MTPFDKEREKGIFRLMLPLKSKLKTSHSKMRYFSLFFIGLLLSGVWNSRAQVSGVMTQLQWGSHRIHCRHYPSSSCEAYSICEDFDSNCSLILKKNHSDSVLIRSDTDTYAVSRVCRGEIQAVGDMPAFAFPVKNGPEVSTEVFNRYRFVPERYHPFIGLIEGWSIGSEGCHVREVAESLKVHIAAEGLLRQRFRNESWIFISDFAGTLDRTQKLFLGLDETIPRGRSRASSGVQWPASEMIWTPGVLSSREEVERLMRDRIAQGDLPYSFLTDACYARAEIFSQYLENHGVETQKIWITGPRLSPELAPGLSWVFHVALVVRIREQGQIVEKVLDPGTSLELLSIDEWTQKIGARGVVLDVPWGELKDWNTVFFVRYRTPSRVYSFHSRPGDWIPNFLERSRLAQGSIENYSDAYFEQVPLVFQSERILLAVNNSSERRVWYVLEGNPGRRGFVKFLRNQVNDCMRRHAEEGTLARIAFGPGTLEILRCQ
jgi:hypothetical protein